MTNGPTCEAFCAKVTIAVSLVLRARIVDSPGVFVPACCSVSFCVVWACTGLICAVLH